METDGLLSAIALAASLVGFAIASLAETSVSSVRRERVQHLVSQDVAGSAALERLHSLSAGPANAVALIRVVSLSSALVSAVAVVIVHMGVAWAAIGLVGLAVLVFLGAVHLATDAIASRHGERISLKIAGGVGLLTWLMGPLLSPGALIFWRTGSAEDDRRGSGPEMIPTEIDLPLEAAAEPLDEREVRMIHGVVRLDTTVAREIMVPRLDIVAAEIGTPIAELAELMVRGGHSRIPIYRGDLDHVEGVAYARDILQELVRNSKASGVLVDSLIRPALFIPELKSLEALLSEFQGKRVHLAIVVDEYGGVSGLVTIEDLLEEIVGEIRDEFELGEPEIQTVGRDEFIIDAGVGLEQLNELLSLDVEGDGFDTIGGFVYQRLGKIPSAGDAVEYDGLRVEVMSTVGRRLKRLRVTRSGTRTSSSG
ncbi:MAG: HlyC/CorC family transporter [Chloroflexi bacterium]|nr:HlyC/CorC family transporter [Chloroflexota bacterium]